MRIGKAKATKYHWFLLIAGFACTIIYTLATYQSSWQFLFVPVFALLVRNGVAISTLPSEKLDPYLKQMALSTLLFVILFGVGSLLA